MAQENIILVQGDITLLDTDAIVNAANSSLMGGGGVDGAIHKAGGPKILAECKEIVTRQGRCPTGQAVLTTGGNLKAKYVIHTVGPIWRGGGQNERELLQHAYFNTLTVGAAHKDIKTIAFPSISTGAYRFPIDQAASIALTTVKDFLTDNPHYRQVRFVLFSLSDLEQYQAAISAL